MRQLMRGIIMLALTMLCGAAWAANGTLSFRVNSLGQIEAVIAGVTGFCRQTPVSGVSTIDIGPTVIAINSVQGASGAGCPEPLPPSEPY